MDEPQICIVGAGILSTRRIYPYIGAAGGMLVGVCDLDQEKAARNTRRFGGRPYADLDAMLDAEKPDGVIICVGPETHARLAPVVLRRGIPVYTEKPPALTSAAAAEVARVAAECGVLCTTAFKKRYTSAANRAKEWLSTFSEADYLSISVDYASGYYTNQTPQASFLLDFAIHIIDLTQYLFGPVTEVSAFTREEHAWAVNLRFENGAVGSMNLNDGRSFTVPTEEIELTVRGGNFMSIHNSSSWKITEQGKPVEWREAPTFASAGDSGHDTGHLAEIEDFFAAIREKRNTTRSCIAESCRTMALYEAILKAGKTRQIVPVVYPEI